MGVLALLIAPYGVIFAWLMRHSNQLGRNTAAVDQLSALLATLLEDRLGGD